MYFMKGMHDKLIMGLICWQVKRGNLFLHAPDVLLFMVSYNNSKAYLFKTWLKWT